MKLLPYDPRYVGARLRHLRIAYGYERQTDICRELGLTPKEWNEWEKGNRRPGFDKADKILARFPVSADWLFYGKSERMSVEAHRKLFPNGNEEIPAVGPDGEDAAREASKNREP